VCLALFGDLNRKERRETMQKRKLGEINLEVSAVGLGAMGFSHGYGPGVSDQEAIALMRKAFDLGCTFFDTAEGYAAGENERLVGRALAPIRDQVDVVTDQGGLVTCKTENKQESFVAGHELTLHRAMT
jgi:aryl-alcohol dehydrogenase-like predicted oxidoreductase